MVGVRSFGVVEAAAASVCPPERALARRVRRSFGACYRLRRRREFDRLFTGPRRRIRAYPFTVLSAPNGLGHPRLGLVVGKRQARRAVERNRIKRVIRESFRASIPRLPAHDIVVIAGHGVTECDNATMFEALESTWTRLNGANES